MTDMLQEFCDSRGASMRVDAPSGSDSRRQGAWGWNRATGGRICPRRLREAARLYEDAKVNVNHPKGNPAGPRDYQDRIGTIRGVAMRAGEGLFGDFHFNPKHALAEQLMWDAEHAPENVGFSHNVEARTSRPRRSRGGRSDHSACRASIWWPIRPRRAGCSSRRRSNRPPRPRRPSKQPDRRASTI